MVMVPALRLPDAYLMIGRVDQQLLALVAQPITHLLTQRPAQQWYMPTS